MGCNPFLHRMVLLCKLLSYPPSQSGPPSDLPHLSLVIVLQMSIAIIDENFSIAEEVKRSQQARRYFQIEEPDKTKATWIQWLNPYRWFKPAYHCQEPSSKPHLANAESPCARLQPSCSQEMTHLHKLLLLQLLGQCGIPSFLMGLCVGL